MPLSFTRQRLEGTAWDKTRLKCFSRWGQNFLSRPRQFGIASPGRSDSEGGERRAGKGRPRAAPGQGGGGLLGTIPMLMERAAPHYTGSGAPACPPLAPIPFSPESSSAPHLSRCQPVAGLCRSVFGFSPPPSPGPGPLVMRLFLPQQHKLGGSESPPHPKDRHPSA